MTFNSVMAVTLCYFTEFGKPVFQHITASICGGIYAQVYCILYCMYDVVVKKVHIRYLISWWVSCYCRPALINCFCLPQLSHLQHVTYSTDKSKQYLSDRHCISMPKQAAISVSKFCNRMRRFEQLIMMMTMTMICAGLYTTASAPTDIAHCKKW